jgi:hypothetical protein
MSDLVIRISVAWLVALVSFVVGTLWREYVDRDEDGVSVHALNEAYLKGHEDERTEREAQIRGLERMAQ